MRRKNNDWIIDFIRIKKHGLDFAYCRGDIEAAHKIEGDIKRLRAIYEKT